MNHLYNAQLRASDRVAEIEREAEMARRALPGDSRSPRLAARLATALRGAAGLLDQTPGERLPHPIAEG
jgi:hypothetical protein